MHIKEAVGEKYIIERIGEAHDVDYPHDYEHDFEHDDEV